MGRERERASLLVFCTYCHLESVEAGYVLMLLCVAMHLVCKIVLMVDYLVKSNVLHPKRSKVVMAPASLPAYGRLELVV